MSATPSAQPARFALGLDYGSNAVRCLIVNCDTRREIAVAVYNYPSGDAGVLGDPRQPHVARQHPRDFLLGLEASVGEALRLAAADAAFSPDRLVGIGVDTTGSTPLAVDAELQPLAFRPAWKNRLDAMAWMWKDHSSIDEAERLTAIAAELRPRYLARCGGVYSSEWFFSKLWHFHNVAPDLFAATASWIELCDWIPAVLAGVSQPQDVVRNICVAGHKALYADEWQGWPDAEFLTRLSPGIAALRPSFGGACVAIGERAGALCTTWATRLGLPAGLPISAGALDAHMGAVGAGCGTGRMVKVLGTSSCDLLVAAPDLVLNELPGVCGFVDGSVIPGRVAVEAGQAAVGDIFNWFVKHQCGGDGATFARLTEEAGRLAPGASGLLALDWQNGNRCVLADARLTGLIVGLTLHSSQADVFRALIEATAFGARRILDRIEAHGIRVDEIVACGGIAEKNPLLMQIYADVLGRRMTLSASSETCALGSAIAGAVVGGVFPTVEAGQTALCRFKPLVYEPDAGHRAVYERLYALYVELETSFGRSGMVDHGGLMKALLAIRADLA